MNKLWAALPLLAALACSAAEPPPPLPLRLILVGDSTMATRTGYGDALCARLKPAVSSCINLARGGRSSGSFRAEGLWDDVLARLKENRTNYSQSVVLIQFGHNDQPGKPGRSTDLATEFPVNLARYVSEAQAVGAQPVLLTPLTRRTFKAEVLQNDLQAWADATRLVAATQKVPLLDLNALSYAAVQAMGETEADTLAMAPKPDAAALQTDPTKTEPQGTTKTTFDRTHLGDKGARLIATMVAQALLRLLPTLAPHFKPEQETTTP